MSKNHIQVVFPTVFNVHVIFRTVFNVHVLIPTVFNVHVIQRFKKNGALDEDYCSV